MELKQIEHFIRIAELGSFTRASIELDVAQPALSRQIRLLEVELGQSLLIRNGRGVSATEAGEVLLEHGRGVLHQVGRVREELSRVRGGMVGRVAVGLPPSLAHILTVPLSRVFRETLPDAMLSINQGLTTTIQSMLVSGVVDVALLYNPQTSPDIVQKLISTQPLCLVEPREQGSVTTAVPLTEVANRPLVIPGRPNTFRMLLETRLSEIGLQPQIALEMDGITSLLDLVIEGIGCAVLPGDTVSAYDRPERLNTRPVSHPEIMANLYIAISSRRPTSQIQQTLSDLLERLVKRICSKHVNP